ncbi:hypothetical protein M0P48_00050 [Candidatus Gracilibacteria bacterium]|nr:hypothetical protein [Candidatus Gracilibacteria bacterium]
MTNEQSPQKDRVALNAAILALIFSLLLPLYYAHCFDDCEWFIWPTIVPGFHWMGGLVNIFIFITFYLLFFATFYIAQRKLESRIKVCIVVVVVWAVATSILAFTETPKKIYFGFGRIILEKIIGIEAIVDRKRCDKYVIGTGIESFDLSPFKEGGNILKLSAIFENFDPTYEMNGGGLMVYNRVSGTKNPEVQYLYSKFEDDKKGKASIKSDHCYLAEADNTSNLLCFINNKLTLKLCPIAGSSVETLSSIIEYDKEAYG